MRWSRAPKYAITNNPGKPITISTIIPARNEEGLLPGCLESVRRSAAEYHSPVECIVVLNRCTDRTAEVAREAGCVIVREDAPNLARIRNAGAAAATGEVLVTIDADSRMHPRTFREIHRKLSSGRYIGGGTVVLLERFSLGICCSMLVLLPYLLPHGISFGLFWCRREDFDAIGGFDQDFVSIEDVDFVQRLKALGKSRGLRFGTLWRAPLTTSCRKFDQFGDWFLVRNPRFLRKVFTGTDRDAADRFWYKAER